jgi:hypothetical protein
MEKITILTEPIKDNLIENIYRELIIIKRGLLKKPNKKVIFPSGPDAVLKSLINGFVERANRTLQEEFINGHEEYALDGIHEFNSRLMDYLIWYNTKRVHKSLGNVSPINNLLKILPPKSQMYVTYTFC